MTDIHIRLKVKGQAQKVQSFNQFMRSLDFDFPFGNGKVPPDIDRTYVQCEKCDGLVWKKAMYTKGDLQRAGTQCGVTVKISQFTEGKACEGETPNASPNSQ